MKVSVEDVLRSQRKTGLKSFVESKLVLDAKAEKVVHSEKDEKPLKTFVLSATGGEIHVGESVVDRISKPETLKEKVARFERLAQKVRENRAYLMNLGAELVGDEDEDDFDFEEGEVVDDFGDVIEITKENDIVQPVEPQPQPSTEPVAEPAAEPVEAA